MEVGIGNNNGCGSCLSPTMSGACINFGFLQGLACLVALFTLAACGGREGSAGSDSQNVSTTAAIIPSPSQGVTSTTVESMESIPVLGSGEEDLEPGRYLLDFQTRAAGGRSFPQVVLTLPEGWQNYEGWLVGAGRDIEANGPHRWFVSFWDVDEVYAHPCDWASEKIDPGRTVEGLVAALVDRPLRDATTPVEVTVDGYQGYMLEWSVPTDIDFASCDEGFFESWTGSGWTSDRYQQGPGQVDRLWILDVDGSRLVIDAMYMPGVTEQDREEIFAVVNSIQFQPVTDG
jgi:hypothetical protein